MALNLRKEQALLLLTVAFGAWMYSGIESSRPVSVGTGGQELAYDRLPVRRPITAEASAVPANLRELYTEPSESRPLPPRELPFLPLPELGVVCPPLPIGPHPAAYDRLRTTIPMLPADAGDGEGGGGNGDVPPADGAGEGGGNGVAALATEDPAQRYDRLSLKIGPSYWGYLLADPQRKFDLGSGGPYTGEIRFQWIDHKTGKTTKELVVAGGDIKSIELAKTLRNELGLQAFKIPTDEIHIREQKDFIHLLLEKARLESWVYEMALERADAYLAVATPKEDGYLFKARVFRAMGDLAAEWRMFQEIDKELQGSSFQLRGLGYIEARLGLDRLAEQHLREAVAKNSPIDPRNHARLAEFLLAHGRAEEAVPFARQAAEFKARVEPSAAEVFGFHEVLVRALLAVGDLKGAGEAVPQMPDAAMRPRADFLSGCIAYAKQDFPRAAVLFQNSANSGDAQFGVAACQLATGEIRAALAGFERIAADHPRLRHLALAGVGLARSQIENGGDEALAQIRAGLVAAPDHPYLLYLLGRQLRRNGDVVAAADPLKRALRERDDFIDALAELAMSYYTRFRSEGSMEALVSAKGYVDRLVELDGRRAAPEPLFLELQGLIHYCARDWAGARRAFRDAGDASDFAVIGAAILDYTQKRTDLAEEAFDKIVRRHKDGHPARAHVERLRELILDHANKERVADNFDRSSLGRNWERQQNGAGPELRDRQLEMKGRLRNSGTPVYARRTLAGAGRFVGLEVEMKVAAPPGRRPTFAGLVLELPVAGSMEEPMFQVRFGMDERGKVMLEMIDSKKRAEPIRTDLEFRPGTFHHLELRAEAEPGKAAATGLFLSARFDGVEITPPIRLKSLRRGAGGRELYTELRVEGREGTDIDVAFRSYARIQEKQ